MAVTDYQCSSGCATLQRLQDTLLEFKGIDLSQHDELRAILSNILMEAEIDAIEYTLRIQISNLLPPWARRAPELRSKSCPREDCFRIGETALDVTMLQVPIDVLNGVRRAQSGIIVGGAYDNKSAGGWPLGPWGRVAVALKPGPNFSSVISDQLTEYGFYLVAIVLFLLAAMGGRRSRLIWWAGLLCVIMGLFMQYSPESSEAFEDIFDRRH